METTENNSTPPRRRGYFGIAGLIVGAISLVCSVVAVTVMEAEAVDRMMADEPAPARVPETGPALSEKAADFLIETGEHAAKKLADRFKEKYGKKDSDDEAGEGDAETQPADDPDAPSGDTSTGFSVTFGTGEPEPRKTSEIPPEKRTMSWTGVMQTGAAGGGALALVLAAVSWVRHERRLISVMAMSLGVLALAWKYVVLGIIIGVALGIAIAILSALG